MAYCYSSCQAVVDNKSKNFLLASHCLLQIINLFVSTFFIANIYTFSTDIYNYLFNVGVYNVAFYLTIAVSYVLFSKIVDKTNRVVVYKIAIILKALLVIMFIFAGKALASVLIVAGILNGLGESLYYSSYNVLKQEMVSRKKMDGFASAVLVLMKGIDIVCPVVLGAIIDGASFSRAAIVVLCVCIVQLVLACNVKSFRPEGSSYNLKGFWSDLKQNKETFKKLQHLYLIAFVFGSSVLMGNIINICTMVQVGSSFKFGLATSAFAVLSIFTVIFMQKFTKPGKRSWVFILAIILDSLAVLLFVFKMTTMTILILNGVVTCTSYVYKYSYDVHRNCVIKESGLYNDISEHHSMVEVLLNVARTIGFVFLILVSFILNLIGLKLLLILSYVGCSLMLILILLYERKYFKQ